MTSLPVANFRLGMRTPFHQIDPIEYWSFKFEYEQS
jgi:hypothetical protein